jgi:hypothetical protein
MRGRFTDVRTRVPLRTDDVVEKKDGGPILLTLSLLPAAAFSFFRIPIPRDPLRLDLTRSSTASTHGARSSTRRRAHGRAPPTPSVGERVRPTPPLLHPPPRKLRGQPNLLLPRWRAHAFGAPLLRPSSRRARDRGPHCSQPVPPRGGARPGRSSLRSDARPCGGGGRSSPAAWRVGVPAASSTRSLRRPLQSSVRPGARELGRGDTTCGRIWCMLQACVPRVSDVSFRMLQVFRVDVALDLDVSGLWMLIQMLQLFVFKCCGC